MAAIAQKHDALFAHEVEPPNLETPRDLLVENAITPNDVFYMRNHGSIPEIDAGSWQLEIEGLVERPMSLKLSEIRDGRFAGRDLVATLQCAGNRRDGLDAFCAIPGEAPWGPGATGTARWRGVALADVIGAAAPRTDAKHVALIGADVSDEPGERERFGGSIPLDKALSGEVILAWEMNGEDLPGLHGAPLRAVVPGFIGARSVKWLESIELRADPYGGYFQDVVYRLLEPGQEAAPGVGLALGEVALNADILQPVDGADVGAGAIEVRGYAFAGGERSVARVDLSPDGGRSWCRAELLDDLGRWAWRTWRAELQLEPGEHELCVRAWDSAAATQPESPASVWNPKGYVNNSWGRTTVHVT